LYNLSSGDVFSIDEQAVRLLDLCECEVSLSEILEHNADFDQCETISYLQDLENAGLGSFLGDKDHVEKVELEPPPELSFLWLEVTARCNLRCLHCYSESAPKIFNDERMTFSDWVRVMEEAYALGCCKIQFIGGEPFFIGKALLDLIRSAEKIGYEFIEVFTNGVLLNEERIDFLARHNIAVAISLYGPSAAVHERVTLGKGSFQKTVMNAKKMQEKGIKLRAAMVVMNVNQDYVEATMKFARENLGIQNVRYDFVRPSGRGCNASIVADKFLPAQRKTSPEFQCSTETFRRMRYGHQCFSRTICVTAAGDVYPCIMERDAPLGNVSEKSLHNILRNNKAKEIRFLNKDNIEVCRDCEYRYACFDCRPKAQGSSPDNNLYAKPNDCQYNPYTGVWGL
ncbi:MAG TPA: radical SAM protein, partial [Candidatus Jorgensenbacteria bacterium]|nr:radical SAM protein [Candidatus Jorgensenbacteria bacterium]